MLTGFPNRGLAVSASWWMLAPAFALAQTSPDLRQVLDRLERLERANQQLVEEVRSLRAELAAARNDQAPPPPVEEKVAVLETQVRELDETKMGASQRFPIRVTGMALFNAFLNSRNNGDTQYPVAAEAGYERNGGATVRQTLIGLEYQGPRAVWGGKVNGSVYMDFFGGSGDSLGQLLRLRTGVIGIDWNQRAISAGVAKPIFAPREPSSFAQVGVSPLTGAGNLWLWVPQVRFEQDLHLGDTSGVRAEIGVVQTGNYLAKTARTAYAPETGDARPGLEGRFEFHTGSERRVELAPGFHTSVNHVLGYSVPSNLFSLDWFVRPWRPLEFTGAFFTGQNVAPLGTGGVGGGIRVPVSGRTQPVHAVGGWGQLTCRATGRLTFNLFSGQQDNRETDLDPGQIGKNIAYGANLAYRLAPNVILGFESSQVRTRRAGSGAVLNNHYDLAVAYLF